MEGGGTLKVDVEIIHLDEVGFCAWTSTRPTTRSWPAPRQLLNTRKEKVVLVTKDTNLRIKADAVGLLAEDYTTDKVEMEELYTGTAQWEVDSAQMLDLLYRRRAASRPEDQHLYPNQFVTLVDRTNPSHTALGRFHGRGGAAPAPAAHGGATPGASSPATASSSSPWSCCWMTPIQVVTLLGKAGTGKTLLAIAAGLQQVVDDERYNKLLVSRPVMPMGRDLGFLPGDMGEKLRPYMQPIYDNLEFIVAANMEMRRRSTMTAGQLEEGGYLSVEPLTYIRGRSIPNQYIIVDEAQNLTPHEVKTILTRAGEGTKVVFTGDPYQIDNPYVDASTNGLSFLAEHFKHLDISGHVTLIKGERSKLAELASNLSVGALHGGLILGQRRTRRPSQAGPAALGQGRPRLRHRLPGGSGHLRGRHRLRGEQGQEGPRRLQEPDHGLRPGEDPPGLGGLSRRGGPAPHARGLPRPLCREPRPGEDLGHRIRLPPSRGQVAEGLAPTPDLTPDLMEHQGLRINHDFGGKVEVGWSPKSGRAIYVTFEGARKPGDRGPRRVLEVDVR